MAYWLRQWNLNRELLCGKPLGGSKADSDLRSKANSQTLSFEEHDSSTQVDNFSNS